MADLSQQWYPYDPAQLNFVETNPLQQPNANSFPTSNFDIGNQMTSYLNNGLNAGQLNYGAGATASGWSKLGDWWNQNAPGVMQGIGAVSSLFNLYGGIKTLGLMGKNYRLDKKFKINNYNANATVLNNQVAQQNATNQTVANAGYTTPGAVVPTYQSIPKWT